MPKQPKPPATSQDQTAKTSFMLRNSLTRKLKYICLKDDKTQTELVDEALSEFIAKWEKKNGAITI